MRAPYSRFLLAISVAGILVLSMAGIASANVLSKTITVANGECVTSGDPPLTTTGAPCGAAVYDPVLGFTGTIRFASGEGLVHLSDFLCENVRGVGGSFTSVGGSYTLTLTDGGTPVAGPTPYSITGGTTCSGTNTQTAFPVSLTVPTVPGGGTYTVQYSLVLAGFDPADFIGDNSILNRIEEQGDGHANSPSVGPPQNPPLIPEAPLAVLLVMTGGLGAAWFISRRMRPTLPAAAA